jgi:excisionase family DNA binding protein
MENQVGRITVGVKEAASMTGLSIWTIRKLVRQKAIPATRFCRRVLIEVSDLQRVVESGKNPAGTTCTA